MPKLSELSPYVRGILEQNHLEPTNLLRYGPRFVCVAVKHGTGEGLFKMVLPLAERATNTTPGYVWNEFDDTAVLEQRLLKEALFLQFFSQELGDDGFEPQIIALSETTPVWSLRTFIDGRTMSAWDSDFIFSPRFFKAFTPRQVIDFFAKLHSLSGTLPTSLTELIDNYTSTLLNTRRFKGTTEHLRQLPEFHHSANKVGRYFADAAEAYGKYERVITHYEPYAPHFFSQNGKVGLIDWENVGWGHKMQDLSVLWMRCFPEPKWQQEYVDILDEYGYFKGNGRLYWESELLIQASANYLYFSERGPIGTPEYDQQAISFFAETIRSILESSSHFKI